MRTRNSIINILTGLGSQVLITLLSFISRTVFISSLGIQYLGINGLFSNILSIISLAESGIGSSIVFSLYKPVAENDEKKILVLMKLYKNAFRVIALIVFLLGISIMPLLPRVIKDNNVDNVYLIYLIFLINSSVSYIFSYKISFLNVCQKKYVATIAYSISSIIAIIVKISILYFIQNYILYLIVDIFITIITTVSLSIFVNKMYPFLKEKCKEKLDKKTKNEIIKNVKSLIIHNIGGRCVFATDNLIISSFISVIAVGIYSNYNMLINICRTFIDHIFNGIDHSMGNLIASESNEKVYSIFKITMLMNFWIYSFMAVCLFILLNPIIELWIGSEFLMSKGTVSILILSFYISGMRRTISMVKIKGGIFYEDRFAPLVEAIINLTISIFLVKWIGINGVFLGTILSTLLVPFWITPYLVYKKIFKKSSIEYFKLYLKFSTIGLVGCIITNLICSFIIGNNLISLIIKIMICLIVPNIVYLICFYKTEEFNYIVKLFKKTIYKKVLI